MGGVSSGAAEAGVIIPTGFGEHRDRLGALQAEAEHLLSGLDELGLSQAAAYLSMALDVMRAARPDPLRTG
jgi:hypothetical protein